MAQDFVRVSKGQIRQYACPECGARPGGYCEGREETGTNHRERMIVAQNAEYERVNGHPFERPEEPTPAAEPHPFEMPGREFTDAEMPAMAPEVRPAPSSAPSRAITGGFAPTDEQLEAVDLAVTGDNLAVEALAGTGKTTTLNLIAEAKPEDGIYVAFNKAIVTEAKQKFPSRVTCATSHSLAFRAVGHRYKHRLNGPRMKSWQIAKRLGIGSQPVETSLGRQMFPADKIAGMVMKGVRVFCQSADREIGTRHIPLPTTMRDDPEMTIAFGMIRDSLGDEIRAAWADVRKVDGQLPFDHNAYLKLWYLEDPFIATDYILFDEAQDANGVTLAIVEAQNDHAQLVFVGDRHQAIYGWNGAVNAMERVEVAHRAWLTTSFRFGPEIAEAANEVLDLLGAEHHVIGAGRPGTRGECDDPSILLSRTNAGAVMGALEEIENGGRPHVIGGADDVVGFARAASKLQRGEMVSHPDLICFTSWGEVRAYVKNDELGSDLALLVGIIDQFGADEIVDLLEHQPRERDATLILSTAHKAKGREWESVRLTPDLAKSGTEEQRLRYVATTRAKAHLDDAKLLAKLAEDDELADELNLDEQMVMASLDQAAADEAAAEGPVVAAEAPEAPPAPAVVDEAVRAYERAFGREALERQEVAARAAGRLLAAAGEVVKHQTAMMGWPRDPNSPMYELAEAGREADLAMCAAGWIEPDDEEVELF
ncbi:MAG TPA: UvrD-helicase domain-containing protein [Acidimicrobiales bacterium]|nr:UvrD-helicase domain-containing protein [Acidimicrobiales bacterium]